MVKDTDADKILAGLQEILRQMKDLRVPIDRMDSRLAKIEAALSSARNVRPLGVRRS